jgi:hypothetical protein
MKKRHARRASRREQSPRVVMVMPSQSVEEIWRRREIREALHDRKARTVRGKPR